jgi:hypothetical protein
MVLNNNIGEAKMFEIGGMFQENHGFCMGSIIGMI